MTTETAATAAKNSPKYAAKIEELDTLRTRCVDALNGGNGWKLTKNQRRMLEEGVKQYSRQIAWLCGF